MADEGAKVTDGVPKPQAEGPASNENAENGSEDGGEDERNTKSAPGEPNPIFEWLQKASSEKIDDAFDLGLKQVAVSDGMLAHVDAKASGLFGVVGFCMTLVVSFGGWALLDNTRKVPFGWGIAIAFLVVLLIGLKTGWHAASALMVRKLGTIDEAQVFDTELLDRTRREYRIVLTAHIWATATTLCEASQVKARALERGQTWFKYFLCGLFGLSALTVLSAVRREKDAGAMVPIANSLGACSCEPMPALAPVRGTRALPVSAPSPGAESDATPAVVSPTILNDARPADGDQEAPP